MSQRGTETDRHTHTHTHTHTHRPKRTEPKGQNAWGNYLNVKVTYHYCVIREKHARTLLVPICGSPTWETKVTAVRSCPSHPITTRLWFCSLRTSLNYSQQLPLTSAGGCDHPHQSNSHSLRPQRVLPHSLPAPHRLQESKRSAWWN